MTLDSPRDDADGLTANPDVEPYDDLPHVPEYLQVPGEAVDRALERYSRHDPDPNGHDGFPLLKDLIREEVRVETVVTVDGQSLLDYVEAADVDL